MVDKLRDALDRPDAAIENLTNQQGQCDEEGVIVQVSRQALEEVLAYLAALSAFTDTGGDDGE